MKNLEKSLKWFFMIGAGLVIILMLQYIGRAPFIAYVELFGCLVAFYLVTMIFLNIYRGHKWYYKLFRFFKKDK